MTLTATHSLPLILDEVEVVRVSRLSPSFARVEFAGPGLADFGVDGPLFDQRIKLIFPHTPGAALPSFAGADESWFATWLDRPVEERGHMRTYTVRDVLGSGVDTRLVVDFALHEGDGESGPGASWAAAARAGDRLVLMGPRRGLPYGGIEFTPGEAGRLLLAGDETAVPAACAILGQLPEDARGAAFLEVPYAADVQAVRHPAGVEVVWLPRDGAPLGSLLGAAVLDHLGVPPVEPVADDEVDPDLWETPTYSSSGEAVAADPAEAPHFLADCYAWIAGESKVVTTLRRALVKELGMDRRQVAFMGYWRQGVAMRS
ncbi:siderophore-interacting protein [Nocardioides ferulae]|uniref:siderophore-interacting protein n=1 Tax=Nocardioides ferulae TaxID=2340821 RepID=UPI001F0B9E59|nr:siderophore-interacting protein [Nocardioides ferulae]